MTEKCHLQHVVQAERKRRICRFVKNAEIVGEYAQEKEAQLAAKKAELVRDTNGLNGLSEFAWSERSTNMSIA